MLPFLQFVVTLKKQESPVARERHFGAEHGVHRREAVNPGFYFFHARMLHGQNRAWHRLFTADSR
jgi:hypothetical protein